MATATKREEAERMVRAVLEQSDIVWPKYGTATVDHLAEHIVESLRLEGLIAFDATETGDDK